MTNKEYYSTENKSVKEMMEYFSKIGMKSYDKRLNSERITFSDEISAEGINFSDEISFETWGGETISPKEAYTGKYHLKFAYVENEMLKRNNACFYVYLNNLNADAKLKETNWSDNTTLIDDIPMIEDAIISGQEVTENVKKNHDLNDFTAFKVCLEKNGFLPTIFQFHQLWKHKNDISKIMKKNGWTKPFEKDTWYWTSVQSSGSGAWGWGSGGYWFLSDKTDICFTVLPFYSRVF